MLGVHRDSSLWIITYRSPWPQTPNMRKRSFDVDHQLPALWSCGTWGSSRLFGSWSYVTSAEKVEEDDDTKLMMTLWSETQWSQNESTKLQRRDEDLPHNLTSVEVPTPKLGSFQGRRRSLPFEKPCCHQDLIADKHRVVKCRRWWWSCTREWRPRARFGSVKIIATKQARSWR
jgi:hypothetical protein